MSRRTRLSVVICTYNGDPHLAAQLESLAAQTRPPDELVVVDDGSTDATAAILRAFAETAPFAVRVFDNAANLGANANFSKALSLADGEILLTCDQDDLWRPDKLERVEDSFAESPEAGLVLHDAALIDGNGRPLEGSLWQTLGFAAEQQDAAEGGGAFEAFTRRIVAYGCVMAVRASLRSGFLPVPPRTSFDFWVALYAAAAGPVKLIREPLIAYRQHARQIVGVRRPSPLRYALELWRQSNSGDVDGYVASLRELRRRLAALPPNESLAIARPRLAGRLAFFEARLRARRSLLRRGPLVARNLLTGSYGRYGQGWKSAALDLVTAPQRLW